MRRVALMVALIGAIGLVSACNEGPAERAGKRIDNAVEKTGDAVERATDKAKTN